MLRAEAIGSLPCIVLVKYQNKIRDLEPLLWCNFLNLKALNLRTNYCNEEFNRIDDIRCLLYLDNLYNAKLASGNTTLEDTRQASRFLTVKLAQNPIARLEPNSSFPFDCDTTLTFG